MSRNGVSWFLTDRGRSVAYYFVGAAVTGSMLVSYMPQTILLENYKDVVRLYKKGISVPVPHQLDKRFKRALELVEVKEEDRPLFQPFMVYGFEIFSLGTDHSRYGVAVGLPINFTYDSLETVEKPSVLINEEVLNWDSEAGEALLHSLVLSEKAQIYAMAREIKLRQTSKVLMDTFFATAAVMVASGFSMFINNKFNLYAKPRSTRLIVYFLASGLAFGNYVFSTDITQVYHEEKVDKFLKEKNPIFAEGGKEFYTKEIERNIALRKLLGKKGEKTYTVLGNENNLFRNKHLPLVYRKNFFEQDVKFAPT